jgi:hypothetical protein
MFRASNSARSLKDMLASKIKRKACSRLLLPDWFSPTITAPGSSGRSRPREYESSAQSSARHASKQLQSLNSGPPHDASQTTLPCRHSKAPVTTCSPSESINWPTKLQQVIWESELSHSSSLDRVASSVDRVATCVYPPRYASSAALVDHSAALVHKPRYRRHFPRPAPSSPRGLHPSTVRLQLLRPQLGRQRHRQLEQRLHQLGVLPRPVQPTSGFFGGLIIVGLGAGRPRGTACAPRLSQLRAADRDTRSSATSVYSARPAS